MQRAAAHRAQGFFHVDAVLGMCDQRDAYAKTPPDGAPLVPPEKAVCLTSKFTLSSHSCGERERERDRERETEREREKGGSVKVSERSNRARDETSKATGDFFFV